MGKKIGEPLSKEPLTAEDARAQQEVLYAAEGKETTGTKEVDETKMYGEMRVTFGVASFAELNALEQAHEVEKMAEYFPQMVGNIFSRPDITDKKQAAIDLAIEFVGIVNEKIAGEAAKEASEPETKEVSVPDDVYENEEYKEALGNLCFGDWIDNYYELADEGVIEA